MPPPRPLNRPKPAGGPPPADDDAPAATASKVLTVAKAKPPCPRIVLYAGEKFGKTSTAAFAPDPVILMARGENGYETLLSASLVPAIPAVSINSHRELLEWLDSLIANPQGRKTVILDAIGGFDVLCQEQVCKDHFGNDWNNPRDGFLAYGADRGYKATATEWRKVLARLDRLNAQGIVVILLGHAKVQAFKNPMGADYDTYLCDCNRHSWAETARWSDCILFGKFRTIIDQTKAQEKAGRGKGIGGTDRVIYTEQRDAFTAGNRYGMPEEFELEKDPALAWGQVWGHITKQ